MQIQRLTAFNAYGVLSGAGANANAAPDVDRSVQSVRTAGSQAARATASGMSGGTGGLTGDVTAMSVDEMTALSQRLYNEGRITLADHSILSFNPEKGTMNTAYGYFTSTPDDSSRLNWIVEFQTRMTIHSIQGDAKAAASDERILNILKGLYAQHVGGGLDVMV